ncbi:hypothetical protein [Bosea sp. (in: a-proteobacteria)]|uniref:hypothetical protein n=1 Tax=Bosea sp. (in: a-proteobacteria) TaxID=1871050 RepID=UPI0026396797|nr:hypothetical protein [Bosea sp. (in: a-proteobacteria)]MCO5092685.1 hypothetical protein [Bosea sp. (in: a-proteobacteria)]
MAKRLRMVASGFLKPDNGSSAPLADELRAAADALEAMGRELAEARRERDEAREHENMARATYDPMAAIIATRQRDEAMAALQEREERATSAIKLADGYGIVLVMIAAGCSDPRRFAKRMLAEYEPEAKQLGITK